MLNGSILRRVVHRALSGSLFVAASTRAWFCLVSLASSFSGWSSTFPPDRVIEHSIMVGAFDQSGTAELMRRARGALFGSLSYRWLTTEPATEAIVVDLRESLAGGTVITLGGRSLRHLLPAYHASAVVGLLSTTREHVADAPIRAASSVLLVAVLVDIVVTVLHGPPSRTGVVARLALLGVAVLGTRVTKPWDDLVGSLPDRLLDVVLEPPEPREDERE